MFKGSYQIMSSFLHFHVNAVHLKTHAIKSLALSLSLSLPPSLSLALLSKYYWLAVTNPKTPRTALFGTYK